jgi:hypothetical protein
MEFLAFSAILSTPLQLQNQLSNNLNCIIIILAATEPENGLYMLNLAIIVVIIFVIIFSVLIH